MKCFAQHLQQNRLLPRFTSRQTFSQDLLQDMNRHHHVTTTDCLFMASPCLLLGSLVLSHASRKSPLFFTYIVSRSLQLGL